MFQKIPADLIFNIFQRLPAPDLISCRCVSKAWYKYWYDYTGDLFHLKLNQTQVYLFDLFSRLSLEDLVLCKFVSKNWLHAFNIFVRDPYFIIHRSRRTKPEADFLVVVPKNNKSDMIYLVNNNTDGIHNTSSKVLSTTCFDMQLKGQSGRLEAVGSSNGLLCMTIYPHCELFYICNPLVGEKLKLPRASILPSTYARDNTITTCSPSPCGFVFDPTLNTYKVIRTWSYTVRKFRALGYGTRMEVYTLGSSAGKWRFIHDVPDLSLKHGNRSQVLLNGTVHWLALNRLSEKNHILAFNVSTESFEDVISLPKQTSTHKQLGLLRDCLCLTHNMSDSIDIWIMEDYRVTWAWRRKYSVKKTYFYPYEVQNEIHVNILKTTSDGSVVLKCGNFLGYYHFKRRKFTPIAVDGIGSQFNNIDAVVHIGSLILPETLDGRKGKTF